MSVIYKKINEDINKHISFFILEIADLEIEIVNLINSLKDMTWLSNFKGNISKSFENKASKTVNYLINKVREADSLDKKVSKIASTLIVKCAQEILSSQKGYKSIPIGDLIKPRIINNEGYDYFAENEIDYYIIFGEGKYRSNTTPYIDAFNQVLDFKKEQKEFDELTGPLSYFVSREAIDKVGILHSYSIGFSIKKTLYEGKYNELYEKIIAHEKCKEISENHEIIIVGIAL